MNPQLRNQTRHDAILDAAFRKHHTDECWQCGEHENNIVETRYGFEVVCGHCGALGNEFALDDDGSEAEVRY